MKVLEVASLQSDVDDIVKNIDSKCDQIQQIQKAIRHFYSLEDDLKGQGGEAIRSFYQDAHEPFLVFLHQSLIDYHDRLREMMDAVHAYESSASGYVNQEFIENNVMDGFDKVKKQTVELTDDANSIIERVQDLVSIKNIDDSEVIENVQSGKDKAENVIEELIILDEYEASQLDQTSQDLQLMKTFLSDIESKFKSGDLSIQNYQVEAISDLTSFGMIIHRVNNGENATIQEGFASMIHKLPIFEIEKHKDAELARLGRGGKDILNMAFNDLENGEIDRQEYLNILNGIKKFDEDVREGNVDIEVSTELVDYVNDKSGEIVSDIADTTGNVVNHGMSIYSMYQAYDLHKKGFEIKQYVTKGGQVRFRVFNPEAIGISKPTKRDTKIYDREHVRHEVRSKNGDNIRIADRVNVRAGAISELKSRAGWLGVAIDTGLNMKDNIQEGESASRIVGDAGVDVGIGAVSLAASGVVGAAVVGTFGAPVIVGAAAALGAGYLVSKVADIKIGDKEISTHIKDGVQKGIKTVAGWFKK